MFLMVSLWKTSISERLSFQTFGRPQKESAEEVSCTGEGDFALVATCFGHGRSATVCSRNTNVIMVWAWMQWQLYALGTRTLSWFGHGCSGNRRRLEQERYHGLGMGAVATVCSRNTNVIMVWAWMLWQPYALRTRTLSWVWAWAQWQP